MIAAGNEPARIGPNAIIQTLSALRECTSASTVNEVLDRAGLSRYGEVEPAVMVPEQDVTALYRALRAHPVDGFAERVASVAGVKTGDYILAYRIPRPAQTLLRLLPPRLAAPLLVTAITRHTWTFAGSGIVSARAGSPARIEIAGCPICRDATAAAPVCAYYAAAFGRLFSALVSSGASAREVACSASGAAACAFEIRY